MSKQVLGYALLPRDVDAYFYDRDLMAELFCQRCGARVSNVRLPLPLHLGKKRQIGSTYDGVILMSSDVADVMRVLSDAETALVHTNFGAYHYFRNLDSIKVDLSFRPVQFENRCSACGVSAEVSHALPLRLLDDGSISPSSVKQTSVQFGDAWLRAPMIVVGAAVREALKQCKPTGLDIAEVYSSSTARWWKAE